MMPKVLWELRRSTADHTVWCAYRRLDPAAHLLTVNVGDDERLREQHSTEADVYEEAAYLLEHFMRKGWTDVAYCELRLASPPTYPTLASAPPSIH